MRVLYALLLFVPVAIGLEIGDANATLIFVASGLALIPLAALLGEATESTAVYTGPQVGALLNATLGNAAELIITIVALREGLIDVVKASIAGSIIGNILLVFGAAALLGGIKHGTQTFNAQTATASAGLMGLAVVSLAIPGVFGIGDPEHHPSTGDIQHISVGIAAMLLLAYVLYLLYSFTTLRTPDAHEASEHAPTMRPMVAVAVLVLSTLAVVVMSEVLVGVIEPTADEWGLSDLFVGVMLVPLVGNVAEHAVAITTALRNKMDLSLGIAIGSGLQIALFVAPVLIFVSHVVGNPMTLAFNGFEMTALLAAVLVTILVAIEGESNWLEGAELVILYAIIGIAFFFVP